MKLQMRLKYNHIFGGLLFLSFMKPSSFGYISPLLDSIFDGLLVFTLLYLLFKFLVTKNLHFDLFFWGICFFWILHAYSTRLNEQGQMFSLVIICAKYVAVYLYVRVEIIQSKISPMCMLVPLEVLMFINIVFFFMYPKGMYTMIGSNGSYYSDQVWIMGGKNGYFYYIFFAFAIFLLENEKMKIYSTTQNIIHRVIFYGLVLINTFIISKSATLIIGVTMILVYLILERNRLFGNKRIIALYYLIFAFLFYFLMFSNNNVGMLKYISNFTGKSTTLTGRTLIWRRSVEAIKNNYLFGYGVENSQLVVKKIGQSTSHNKYLWILYRGGCASFGLFVVLMIYVFNNLRKSYSVHLSKYYMVMTIVLCILWIVEVYDNNMLIFAFLLMCYYVTKIEDNYLNENNKIANYEI